MPFKALLGGDPVSALVCDDATWARLRDASSAGAPTLALPCCGRRAFAKSSPLGTRFFQHAPRPVTEAECPREGESEAHREIKKAVALAIDGFEGWSADVEFSAAGWRADVLATHSGGALPPVAFEVQLSSQAWDATRRRDDGYTRGGVAAVWIVNAHNDRSSFGSDRRLPLPPEAEGIETRTAAAARGARSYLRRLAWQARAVEAAADEMSRHADLLDVEKDGAVPAVVASPDLGRPGGVRMVFAVAGLRDQGGDLPEDLDGADEDEPAPMFIRWAGKAGYRGIRRHTVAVPACEPETIARKLVADVAAGRLRYVPRYALPASLVHYTETCRGCLADIHVCRWAVIGAGQHLPTHAPSWLPVLPPFVVPASDLGWPHLRGEGDAWTTASRRLGQWSTLWPAAELGGRGDCPHCFRQLPPHRLAAVDALAWPAENRDGWWRPERGVPFMWSRMRHLDPPPPAEQARARWDVVLRERSAAPLAEIEGIREANRRAREEAEARRAREAEIMRRAAERRMAREADEAAAMEAERQALAAERAAELKARAAAAEQRAADARVKEAEKLAAAVYPGDPARAALWLNSKRGMMSLRDWAAKSPDGLKEVEVAAKRDRRRR